MKDHEIPAYCRDNGVDALISANFRDFGAKLPLYEALGREGISVIVLRPRVKKSLGVEQQLSVLSNHVRTIARRLLAASNPILLRANESSVVLRTLDQLRAEILGEKRLP